MTNSIHQHSIGMINHEKRTHYWQELVKRGSRLEVRTARGRVRSRIGSGLSFLFQHFHLQRLSLGPLSRFIANELMQAHLHLEHLEHTMKFA